MRRLLTVLLLTACVPSLTACDTPARVIERPVLIRAEIPIPLRTCAPRPPKPPPACTDARGAPALCERDALEWLAQAVIAGDDCRATLACAVAAAVGERSGEGCPQGIAPQ